MKASLTLSVSAPDFAKLMACWSHLVNTNELAFQLIRLLSSKDDEFEVDFKQD